MIIKTFGIALLYLAFAGLLAFMVTFAMVGVPHWFVVLLRWWFYASWVAAPLGLVCLFVDSWLERRER